MDEPNITLDEAEVRRLVRLLDAALSPDDGREAKVGRLMAGLCEWVDADGWFYIRTRIATDGRPENLDFFYGGSFDPKHLAAYGDRSLEVGGEPPENTAVKRAAQEGRAYAVVRQEVCDDAAWAGPPNSHYVRKMGHDAHLWTVTPLGDTPDGRVALFVMMARKTGKPQFDPRLARLAELVVRECGTLHAQGIDLEQAHRLATAVGGLTPRQKVVLAMLVDGYNVPALARHLAISPHTAKDHVKAIYRHLDVKSRPALLRRMMMR